MYRIPLLISALLVCISCSSQVDTVPADEPSAEPPAESKKQPPKLTINCSAPAQVQDKSKIEAMLLKNGTITSDMSTEEKSKIVSDFIKRKTKLYKDCIK